VRLQAKCEIWDIDDKEMKIFLATVNRLRGTDDIYKRARLIKELSEDFEDKSFVELLPESTRAIDSMLKFLEKESDFDIETERGLIEEQLTRSGIDTETAEKMANLYDVPKGVLLLKFVFKDGANYNKAVKFFGKKPDENRLIELLDFYKKKQPKKEGEING